LPPTIPAPPPLATHTLTTPISQYLPLACPDPYLPPPQVQGCPPPRMPASLTNDIVPETRHEQRQVEEALLCALAMDGGGRAGGSARGCSKLSFVEPLHLDEPNAPLNRDPTFEALLQCGTSKAVGKVHPARTCALARLRAPLRALRALRGPRRARTRHAPPSPAPKSRDRPCAARSQLAALLPLTKRYCTDLCKSTRNNPLGAPCEYKECGRCLFAHNPSELRRDPLAFFQKHRFLYAAQPCPLVASYGRCDGASTSHHKHATTHLSSHSVVRPQTTPPPPLPSAA